jgi:hypothetical protein
MPTIIYQVKIAGEGWVQHRMVKETSKQIYFTPNLSDDTPDPDEMFFKMRDSEGNTWRTLSLPAVADGFYLGQCTSCLHWEHKGYLGNPTRDVLGPYKMGHCTALTVLNEEYRDIMSDPDIMLGIPLANALAVLMQSAHLPGKEITHLGVVLEGAASGRCPGHTRY